VLTALILFSRLQLHLTLEKCTRKNAAAEIRVPAEFGNPITCLMHAQAYLAETSIGQDLGSNDRVKIICVRTADREYYWDARGAKTKAYAARRAKREKAEYRKLALVAF